MMHKNNTQLLACKDKQNQQLELLNWGKQNKGAREGEKGFGEQSGAEMADLILQLRKSVLHWQGTKR